MAVPLIYFVAGVVLLALAGDALVKSSAAIARRSGVSPFATGLVLVAFATSLPELSVNLWAMAADAPALALGNAVGSNIANFGLTLGAAALSAPLLVRWKALPPLLVCLVVATLATILLAQDGRLTRVDGAVLLAAFVIVLAFAWAFGRGQPERRGECAGCAASRAPPRRELPRLLVAIALLWFGGKWVVEAALALRPLLGMESLLMGLLPVAIATALPETAAAVAEARRGQGDLVAGHVIGSSLVNLLLVVGGMALVRDVPVPGPFLHFELPAAVVFAALLLPMLRGGMQVSRAEGAVLLLAFAAWLGFELLLA